MQPCSRIKRSVPRLGLELQSGVRRQYSQASLCLEMLQRAASRLEAQGGTGTQEQGVLYK